MDPSSNYSRDSSWIFFLVESLLKMLEKSLKQFLGEYLLAAIRGGITREILEK